MTKCHTEVTSHGDGTADTLTVTPSSDATTIVVTIEDANGNLLDQQAILTGISSTLSLCLPPEGSGSLLRIRDDNCVVYEEEN